MVVHRARSGKPGMLRPKITDFVPIEFSWLTRIRLGLRTQLGEENDVANAFRAGQQNDEAVDAHAHATGGRHALFARRYKMLIDLLLFFSRPFFCHPAPY